jgi:hypothetical protein
MAASNDTRTARDMEAAVYAAMAEHAEPLLRLLTEEIMAADGRFATEREKQWFRDRAQARAAEFAFDMQACLAALTRDTCLLADPDPAAPPS